MRQVTGYASKAELLERRISGRRVLHLGAVGETYSDPQARIDLAPESVHAWITAVAAECVGVDYDAGSVKALTESGTFDNLICADVTTLTREEIPLEHIDVVVIGDIIEHLSRPGDMLDAMHNFIDEGTEVVLTTPNALALPVFLRHLRDQEIEGVDHVASFNRASLENLLTRHGWRIEDLWTCYQRNAEAIHGKVRFRAGRAFFERMPKLGGTLLAVIRPA
jgi:2-polyprenyl-3-methyl-5-hydroxy-6-metoxy-1,4-benzoquinol methylase